jgi:hypothetical protein
LYPDVEGHRRSGRQYVPAASSETTSLGDQKQHDYDRGNDPHLALPAPTRNHTLESPEVSYLSNITDTTEKSKVPRKTIHRRVRRELRRNQRHLLIFLGGLGDLGGKWCLQRPLEQRNRNPQRHSRKDREKQHVSPNCSQCRLFE